LLVRDRFVSHYDSVVVYFFPFIMSLPETAHSRRSRLTVPSGGDSIMASSSSVSSSSQTMTMTTPLTTAGSSGTTMMSSSGAGLSALTQKNVSTQQQFQQQQQQQQQHQHQSPPLRTSAIVTQYMQRMMDIRQMDVQATFDQMRTIVSSRPASVYKTAYYRKQTKNHWFRDDPAFVAIQCILLIISSIVYSVAFRISILGAISFLFYTVLWNFLFMGIIISTACREIANRHLTTHSSSFNVRQQVEWLFAFDIHCNSFFTVFVLLCT
jgi:hypothetical protein